MKIKMHTQILIALAGGIALGRLFPQTAENLKFIGDLFIRLLKMIIIPLVMASMISGIVSIPDWGHLGRIGLRTFLYYLATTVMAILVGLLLVNLIRPGLHADLPRQEAFDAETHTPPTPAQIITDIVPDNIIAAMARLDVLPVIFFSLLFGIALSAVREKAAPVIEFFQALDIVMMKLTGWIMAVAPIGVFALIAHLVSQMGLRVLADLIQYILTVISGLLIHACVTLPLLLWVVAKIRPFRFFQAMCSALAAAFSTASSAATLPLSIELLREKVGVSKRITGFVMPLGATVNMDGTALYEAVAALFIAQAYGMELGLAQQMLIVITATLASIGAAAIPSAGLITMVIVLKAVNLPLEGIAMIWAVDRLLDMCRTAVNVWGDSCGAVLIARLDGETLASPDLLRA